MRRKLTPRRILDMITIGHKMRRQCWSSNLLYCRYEKERGELQVLRLDPHETCSDYTFWDHLPVYELFYSGWEVVE